MADFGPAIRRVLRAEGVVLGPDGRPAPNRATGYVDDPRDRGGETNWGITIGLARDQGYQGSMRALPFDTALAIYRSAFWERIRGDEMTDQGMANEVLDAAVNCGVQPAVKMLQRALNALNGGTHWPDLVVDGGCGPATMAALAAAGAKSPLHAKALLALFIAFRRVRYAEITEGDPSQKVYTLGWLNRTGSGLSA